MTKAYGEMISYPTKRTAKPLRDIVENNMKRKMNKNLTYSKKHWKDGLHVYFDEDYEKWKYKKLESGKWQVKGGEPNDHVFNDELIPCRIHGKVVEYNKIGRDKQFKKKENLYLKKDEFYIALCKYDESLTSTSYKFLLPKKLIVEKGDLATVRDRNGFSTVFIDEVRRNASQSDYDRASAFVVDKVDTSIYDSLVNKNKTVKKLKKEATEKIESLTREQKVEYLKENDSIFKKIFIKLKLLGQDI